jgi:ABC-type polysaccharide/polyol phosphate transport system ATPase subunit
MRQTARRQGKLTRLRRRLTRRAAPAAMARGSELDDHAGEQAAGAGSVSVLRQVHMSVAHGSLVGVVGAVASGKTSLLLGMLGELPRTAGSVEVRAMCSGPLSALMNREVRKRAIVCHATNQGLLPLCSPCTTARSRTPRRCRG